MSEHKNGEEKEVSRAVHTDLNSVRKNERSIRVLKRITALLIVLLVGLGIYVTYPHWLPKLEGIFDRPSGTIFNDGKTADGNFPIQTDDQSTKVFAVNNDLMTADAHSVTFYDQNGKKRDSYSHAFSNPVIKVGGKRVLVFDSGSPDMRVYNKSGEIYSKKLDNDILAGAIGEDGTAALVTTNDKYAASLFLYTKDGKLKYRYDCMQRITSAYVTPDGKSCYLTTFSSENGDIFTQVRRLDLDKDGEQMVSENLSCLGLGCICDTSGNIIVVGDGGLYTVASTGQLVSVHEYTGDLLGFSQGEGCTAAIVKGTAANTSELIIAQAGAQGEEAYREVPVGSYARGVSVADERVIMITSDAAAAYDYTAALTASAELEKNYYSFEYLDGAIYLSGKHGIDKIGFDM